MYECIQVRVDRIREALTLPDDAVLRQRPHRPDQPDRPHRGDA